MLRRKENEMTWINAPPMTSKAATEAATATTGGILPPASDNAHNVCESSATN